VSCLRQFALSVVAILVCGLFLPVAITTKAEADNCTYVAELEEQYRLKNELNWDSGFTKSGVNRSTKVYQAVLDNRGCVSRKRFQDVLSATKEVQGVCRPMKPTNPTYSDWKFKREFWQNMYRGSFPYLCEKFLRIKLPK
jgi:hypothetical protein